MSEIEPNGASTRRVLRQACDVMNKEMEVMYADRRDYELKIAVQKNLIELHEGEVETLKSLNRNLEANIVRDRARANQDCWINDFTIYFAACGWIVALIAIGYGVWVG